MITKKNQKRIKQDAYFTVDTRPIKALFLGCPELIEAITGIYEPFCGGGHMTEDLRDMDFAVFPGDIEDHGYKGQIWKQDFLDANCMPLGANTIISNPPYNRWQILKIIEHAMRLLPEGGFLCFLMNHRFDAAGERAGLFQPGNGFYARVVLPFRIWWFERHEDDKRPAQNHTWFVLQKGYKGEVKSIYLKPELFADFDETNIRSRELFCKTKKAA